MALGGFFLGMLVPIGLLIALLIKDEKRKNRITTAIISTLIISVVGLMVIAVISVSTLFD